MVGNFFAYLFLHAYYQTPLLICLSKPCYYDWKISRIHFPLCLLSNTYAYLYETGILFHFVNLPFPLCLLLITSTYLYETWLHFVNLPFPLCLLSITSHYLYEIGLLSHFVNLLQIVAWRFYMYYILSLWSFCQKHALDRWLNLLSQPLGFIYIYYLYSFFFVIYLISGLLASFIAWLALM